MNDTNFQTHFLCRTINITAHYPNISSKNRENFKQIVRTAGCFYRQILPLPQFNVKAVSSRSYFKRKTVLLFNSSNDDESRE